MKPTPGGKRAGAGRPARKVAKVALTVKLEPEHRAKFAKICTKNKRSQSVQVTHWIENTK